MDSDRISESDLLLLIEITMRLMYARGLKKEKKKQKKNNDTKFWVFKLYLRLIKNN